MADTFFGDNDMGKIMIVQESVKNRDNAIALKSLLFLSDNGTALYQVLMIMTGRPSLWSRWR